MTNGALTMPEIFTIKTSDLVLKVNIAKETRAKYRYAIEHFQRLNDLQDEQIYYFTFLTPSDFDNFFGMLKRKKIYRF